jgi:hypothetical protein
MTPQNMAVMLARNNEGSETSSILFYNHIVMYCKINISTIKLTSSLMPPLPSLQIGQHMARYPSTRFITTDECDADIRYKEFHLHVKPEDVVIISSPVGMPGRALRHAFVEKAIANSSDLEKRCLASCMHVCQCRDEQKHYCIVQVLDKAARGDVENGLVFSGSNAGRAQKIVPVAELMAELVA